MRKRCGDETSRKIHPSPSQSPPYNASKKPKNQFNINPRLDYQILGTKKPSNIGRLSRILNGSFSIHRNYVNNQPIPQWHFFACLQSDSINPESCFQTRKNFAQSSKFTKSTQCLRKVFFFGEIVLRLPGFFEYWWDSCGIINVSETIVMFLDHVTIFLGYTFFSLHFYSL
jgi:hypothetical protein